MKKILIEDKFVDFKGIERPFVVCGMIQSLEKSVWPDYYDLEGINKGTIKITPTSVLSIGLSVCHENDLDKVDSELGKKLAEGRAEKARESASVVMLINNDKFTTNRFLQETVKGFVADLKYAPGKYIKGYNDSEIRYYNKNKKLAKKLENEGK